MGGGGLALRCRRARRPWLPHAPMTSHRQAAMATQSRCPPRGSGRVFAPSAGCAQVTVPPSPACSRPRPFMPPWNALPQRVGRRLRLQCSLRAQSSLDAIVSPPSWPKHSGALRGDSRAALLLPRVAALPLQTISRLRCAHRHVINSPVPLRRQETRKIFTHPESEQFRTLGAGHGEQTKEGLCRARMVSAH